MAESDAYFEDTYYYASTDADYEEVTVDSRYDLLMWEQHEKEN